MTVTPYSAAVFSLMTSRSFGIDRDQRVMLADGFNRTIYDDVDWARIQADFAGQSPANGVGVGDAQPRGSADGSHADSPRACVTCKRKLAA